MTIDERFDRIDKSLETLVRRFDNVDGSIESLNLRADRSERSLETLTQYLLDFRQETASRFQTIETRLDVIAATVASIDSRFPAMNKAILDFGTLSTQLVREQPAC